MAQFHEIIQKAREKQMMVIDDLAVPLGYSRSHTCNILQGNCLPRRRDIPIFARVLGLNADTLNASVSEFQESKYRKRKQRQHEYKPRNVYNQPKKAVGKTGLTHHDLLSASPEKLIRHIKDITSGRIPYAGLNAQG